jgi:glycosyltransferase involved in cell wall biosynthesis
MKTTVIILTSGAANRHILIKGLLRSLARQSVKPSEVIIATETAGEELAKTASEYLGNIDFRVIETGYWNKCWTANKAILESKGDIVFLLEDDLYLAPNFIEEVLKTFEEYPEASCVYTKCIWVFREGVRSKGGLIGWLAKTLSKLSVHESVLPKMVKKINDHLAEIPVFTMSVACKKEALLKAGLYDTRVKEPILGEDYDLALRIRKTGYKIIQTTKTVSYHLTKQVSKGIIKYSKDPAKIMGTYETEIYFMTKNRDVLRLKNVVSHVVYRLMEAMIWSVRARNIRVVSYGIAGLVKGFVKGILYQRYWASSILVKVSHNKGRNRVFFVHMHRYRRVHDK